jgi:hypothetical protein
MPSPLATYQSISASLSRLNVTIVSEIRVRALPVEPDQADRGQAMVAPAREQAEHPAQIGLVLGLGEDAAADGDRGVAGEDDLVLGARDRMRLGQSDAQHIGTRQFAGMDILVDIGGGDARGRGADPREQIAAGAGEVEARTSRTGPTAHLKR